MPGVDAARPVWGTRFKDATLAAIVAAVLAIPLIGLHAVDATQGLRIETRFGWAAVFVAAVFVGRLLLGGVSRFHREHLYQPLAHGLAHLRPLARVLPWLGLGFAVVLPLLPFANRLESIMLYRPLILIKVEILKLVILCLS